MFTKHKVPLKIAQYYGAVLPGEGDAPFLLMEDLTHSRPPSLIPGVTGGILRQARSHKPH